MPYADKSDTARASRRHYDANKDEIKAKMRDRRNKAKKFIDDLKKTLGPCLDCGIEYPPHMMDFDHRPDEIKEFTISSGVRRALVVDRLLTEIAKCDYVCSNCHRDRTWRRQHTT